MKAKKIKEFSHQKNITYAEATKQINLVSNSENQTKQTSEKINEDQIISKVFEKVKSSLKKIKNKLLMKLLFKYNHKINKIKSKLLKK